MKTTVVIPEYEYSLSHKRFALTGRQVTFEQDDFFDNDDIVYLSLDKAGIYINFSELERLVKTLKAAK
jgi:hypothetical protein